MFKDIADKESAHCRIMLQQPPCRVRRMQTDNREINSRLVGGIRKNITEGRSEKFFKGNRHLVSSYFASDNL
jgi:hypothetical protein